MSFLDAYDAAHHPQLNQRVRVALLLHAQQVASGTPTAADKTLIERFMASGDSLVQIVCDLVCANGVTAAVDDSTISSAVTAVWPLLAAV